MASETVSELKRACHQATEVLSACELTPAYAANPEIIAAIESFNLAAEDLENAYLDTDDDCNTVE